MAIQWCAAILIHHNIWQMTEESLGYITLYPLYGDDRQSSGNAEAADLDFRT